MSKLEFRLPDATTRSGLKVVGVRYVPYNDVPRPVTYPVKGTIVYSKRKTRYQIWAADGQVNVMKPDDKLDLVDLNPQLAVMHEVLLADNQPKKEENT